MSEQPETTADDVETVVPSTEPAGDGASAPDADETGDPIDEDGDDQDADQEVDGPTGATGSAVTR
jgi:hypothetical protein